MSLRCLVHLPPSLMGRMAFIPVVPSPWLRGAGSPPLPLRAVIVIVPIVSVLSYVMLVADVCMRKCLLVAERMSQSMINSPP